MRKKAITFAAVIVGVLTMVMVVSAFALKPTQSVEAAPTEQSTSIVEAASMARSLSVEQEAYTESTDGFDVISLMFDENGEPVSEDMLEANLDKAIADGYLAAEDKEFLLDMFSYCVSDGIGAERDLPCGPGGAGFGSCPFSGGW